MIGELHATFVFDTAEHAKVVWEKLEKRLRRCSVNRWSLSQTDPKQGRAITVLTEESERAQFEKALMILARAGGVRIEPPEWLIEAQRNKRDGVEGRRIIRAPSGMRTFRDGTQTPARKPRG